MKHYPDYQAHLRTERCAFCHRLADIYAADLSDADEHAAVEALFDQSERAAHARQLYGRRRGYHR